VVVFIIGYYNTLMIRHNWMLSPKFEKSAKAVWFDDVTRRSLIILPVSPYRSVVRPLYHQ
jgi:hypothetical protein